MVYKILSATLIFLLVTGAWRNTVKLCYIISASCCVAIATIALLTSMCSHKRLWRIAMIIGVPVLAVFLVLVFAVTYGGYADKVHSTLYDALVCGDAGRLDMVCPKNNTFAPQCQLFSPERFANY